MPSSKSNATRRIHDTRKRSRPPSLTLSRATVTQENPRRTLPPREPRIPNPPLTARVPGIRSTADSTSVQTARGNSENIVRICSPPGVPGEGVVICADTAFLRRDKSI